MKKLQFWAIILSIMSILAACTSSDTSQEDYVFWENPEGTLAVAIPAETILRDWKRSESNLDVSLRISYEPMHDKTKQVIVAFYHSEVDIRSDYTTYYNIAFTYLETFLDNYANSGLTWVPESFAEKNTTINRRPAIQFNTDLINADNEQEIHFSVIVAEGVRHYLVITIFCEKDNYIEERSSPLWQVIESVDELDVLQITRE